MKIPARSSASAGGAAALPPERCLAKTWELPQRTLAGRTVEEHCRIAGAVAACLCARLNAVVPGLLPPGAELPALLHDVGKASLPFQKRLYDAITDRGPDAALTGAALAKADLAWESSVGGHGAVSRACLAGLGAPAAVARIAGAHHGRALKTFADDAAQAGGPAWQTLRREICRRLLGGRTDWPQLEGRLERIVGGLTVTADWIASGPLFDNPREDWEALIERAVDEAGFRWPDIRPGLSFEDIFGFAPRPAQRALYEAISGPGVFVLEAPMGLGKTEAALYAAYRMLEQQKSCGLYFALPTQLTSNRIHRRVNAFLSSILNEEGEALLLHGMAWLERFQRQCMGAEAAPNQAWFARGRRGILAPFGVGTIEQALFSVLNVRHGALRSFGLAGKTVILDEVHSYDAYTGTILDALIEQLRAMRCTVIILSATLTAQRRAAILPGVNDAPSTAYPLISAAPEDAGVREIACDPGESAETRLRHASEEAAQEEALRRAEAGERVLWIENTVAEAQERFRLLAGRAAAMRELPTGLLHSRFTPADRRRNEDRWAAFFHPQAEERGERGGIVVGTQVVEQSLDLDADFLVSRFCPSDMLLQRLGRLWRHGGRTARPASARREACLLHPSLEEAAADPGHAFGPSGYVYAPYVLSAVWNSGMTETACICRTIFAPCWKRPMPKGKKRNPPCWRHGGSCAGYGIFCGGRLCLHSRIPSQLLRIRRRVPAGRSGKRFPWCCCAAGMPRPAALRRRTARRCRSVCRRTPQAGRSALPSGGNGRRWRRRWPKTPSGWRQSTLRRESFPGGLPAGVGMSCGSHGWPTMAGCCRLTARRRPLPPGMTPGWAMSFCDGGAGLIIRC